MEITAGHRRPDAHLDRLPDSHPDEQFVLPLCRCAHELAEAGCPARRSTAFPAGSA